VNQKPKIFNILSIIFMLFGLFAIGGSVFLWGEGFYFDFPLTVDLALPTADIFVNGPVSILAGIGLWKMRQWGFVAAWMTAGIYLYASVEVFVWAWQEGSLTLPILVPQLLAVIAALVVMAVCWKWKDHFK